MRADTYNTWWRPKPAEGTASLPVPGGGGLLQTDQRDGKAAFWALIAFTFILLLAPQARYPVLAPLRIALLAAAAAVLTYVFGRLARNQPLIEMNRGLWLVTLLVGWAIVTIPFSYWPGGSVSFLTSTYFKTLIVFVLLTQVINTLPRLHKISWTLALLAVPLAWTTVTNYLSGNLTAGNRIMGYEAGLTGNPNDMALMLNLILPFCIALFLGSRGAGKRFVLAGIILLLVFAIIATFSRAGFLALGVTFICYMWFLRRRPERIFAPLVLVLAIGAVPFLPDTYLDRMSTITDIEEDASGSAQERWRDMWAAAEFVAQHPISGAGVGQNVLAMNEVRGETWLNIHNVYLMYAVELGIPGLILFLMFYGACFRSTRETLRRAARHTELDRLFYITEGIRVSLFAFAVEAFFHPVAYHFYFYYIAGLALAVRHVCDVEESKLEARLAAQGNDNEHD